MSLDFWNKRLYVDLKFLVEEVFTTGLKSSTPTFSTSVIYSCFACCSFTVNLFINIKKFKSPGSHPSSKTLVLDKV